MLWLANTLELRFLSIWLSQIMYLKLKIIAYDSAILVKWFSVEARKSVVEHDLVVADCIDFKYSIFSD